MSRLAIMLRGMKREVKLPHLDSTAEVGQKAQDSTFHFFRLSGVQVTQQSPGTEALLLLHGELMLRHKTIPRMLSKQYRYSTAWAGPLGEGITIQPVGMDDPREQNRFHTEINLISRLLFGIGAAANTVYNAHGPIIFQHPDMNVNRQRAKRVTEEWRRLKREGVDIIAYYRSRKA